MVYVSRTGESVFFEILGLHRLWSLKRTIVVRAANIVGARRESPSLWRWAGWRLPGTFVPGMLVCGTFRKDGKRTFWDVHDPRSTIRVSLKDEPFSALVIEVQDPDAALAVLAPPTD